MFLPASPQSLEVETWRCTYIIRSDLGTGTEEFRHTRMSMGWARVEPEEGDALFQGEPWRRLHLGFPGSSNFGRRRIGPWTVVGSKPDRHLRLLLSGRRSCHSDRGDGEGGKEAY